MLAMDQDRPAVKDSFAALTSSLISDWRGYDNDKDCSHESETY